MSYSETMRDKLKCDRRDFRDEQRDSRSRHQVWNRMQARMAELKAKHAAAVEEQNTIRALACRMAMTALQARMDKVWV